MIDLTEEQIERYSRHIVLQDVGLEGQEKILNAKVLIIGAGGLGAPAALYLAAAGVGTIGIVDADNVDLSNLQRQVIHFTKDVGKPKVESAKEKMLAINPDIKVNAIKEFLFSDNALDIIKDYDFVIDGMLGTIQAAEALKYILGIGNLLTNRLLTFDAKTMEFRTIPVKKRDSCPICGSHPTIDHLIDYEQKACDLPNHK